MKILCNVDLKTLNTYRLGEKVSRVFYPESVKDIKTAINMSKKLNLKYKILGNGSNILFKEENFVGSIICLKEMNKIKFLKNNLIFVESGAMLSNLVSFMLDNSLTGLEWACGIPATVGGATFNNAGCFDDCFFNHITKVEYLDEHLKLKNLIPCDKNFAYRYSCFKNTTKIITGVEIKTSKGCKEEIKNKMQEIVFKRTSLQPKGFCAGSVFKNPNNISAGKLIDDCGLKNLQMGDAIVSSKHANFIMNLGNAKCEDVLKLIEIVKTIVYNKYGINLECEIETI